MCGIYGAYGAKNLPLVKALQLSMLNRGPDKQGIYSDDDISLGMNRLHLWGEKTNEIPFEMNSCRLSFNGEIYGGINPDFTYKPNNNGGIGELKFAEENQRQSVLDGMYAIAEYNTAEKTLTLSRDRFGIKPLFYTCNNRQIIFSSCIRSLTTALPGYRPALHPDALFDIFAYGYPLTDQTAFTGIKELMPGYELLAKNNSVTLKPLHFPELSGYDSGVKSIRTTIRRALEGCIKGAYKIGLAVSGGIDSTILAHELNAMGVTDIETFSVVLEEAGDGVRELSDLGFSGKGPWNTWKHHYVEINPENFTGHALSSTDHFQYPTDMHSLPLYNILAKCVAERGIRILLTGEGVDEFFMGYNKYLDYRNTRRADRYYLLSAKGRFMEDIFDPAVIEGGVQRVNRFAEGDFWSQIRSVEIRCRLQKLLHRTDVILMEHSIEGRTPFLHGGLPEIALGSPVEKVRGPYGKTVIRKAYSDIVKGLMNKPKKRFKASEQLFIDTFNRPAIKEYLYEPIHIDGVNLNSNVIDKIYRAYENGTQAEQSDLSELLFLILTTKKSLKSQFYEAV